MNPGAFDTHITVQKQTISGKNSVGEYIYTWETHTTVWAKKDFGSVKESKQNEQVIGSGIIIFVIQYFAGITAKMRILDDDGNIFNLTGPPREIGRKQYLQLETEIFDNE